MHPSHGHVIVLGDMNVCSATTLATRKFVGVWIDMDEKSQELGKEVRPSRLASQQLAYRSANLSVNIYWDGQENLLQAVLFQSVKLMDAMQLFSAMGPLGIVGVLTATGIKYQKQQ